MNHLVKFNVTDKETLVLQIESSYMKYEDDLSKALGIDFMPTRMYRFVGSDLTADETQIEALTIDDLACLSLVNGRYYLVSINC
jgi:hypothetical protein